MSWEPAEAEGVRQAAHRSRHGVLVLTVAYAPLTRAIPYPRSSGMGWPPNIQTSGLAPTNSPACSSHDQTGFQPVAYWSRPLQETGPIQWPAWPGFLLHEPPAPARLGEDPRSHRADHSELVDAAIERREDEQLHGGRVAATAGEDLLGHLHQGQQS